MKLFTWYQKYMTSIKSKLIVSVILIHAILMSLIVFDLLQREKKFMEDRVLENAYQTTAIIAKTAVIPFLNNDLVALDELISSLDEKHNNSMVFILDKFGKVKSSTKKEYFNKYFDDDASKKLLNNLEISKSIYAQSIYEKSVDTIYPIFVEQEIIGYVRTLVDKSYLSNQLSIITNKGVLYIVLAIILGAFFAWLSVRKVTSRLNNIVNAVEQISAKKFDVKLAIGESEDEVSKMAKAFNSMSYSIQGYVDELQKSNEVIYREKELAEITLSSIADCVIVTNNLAEVKFINPAAEEIIKYNMHDAQGKKIEKLFKLFEEDEQTEIEENLYMTITTTNDVKVSEKYAVLENRNNEKFFILLSSASIRNLKGETEGAILVFHDVSHKVENEKKVQWQATHDALTQLNNRLGFETVLNILTKQPIRDNSHHVLLFMDLDKFKIINDTVGHLAGDEVLKQVALLLLESTRKNDFLARFGGDEFGLILFNCTIELAKEIAQKLIDEVLAYSFKWEDKEFKIGLSIGIASINAKESDTTSILSKADLACYMAKEQGRNRYYIARESDLEYLQNEHKFSWVSKINDGLQKKKFVLHIQKIKDLNGDNDHYEVLIRLKDENNILIYPDSFLPYAEKYALLPKIDRYVIEEFFHWLHKNQKTISKRIKFSLNITGQSISDISFVHDVLKLVEIYEVDCSRVIFEITESTAIANINESTTFFQILKAKGFSFSLDDFGTGLSSFAYLKSLPIDYLKIDGTFIKHITKDMIDRGMVESIFKIGSLMNLKIIAEYTENDEIIKVLKTIGIHYAQGYAVEKSHSIEDLLI